MPFNAFLGIKVVSFDTRSASLTFEWKEILVGNPASKSLHGGIIAAVLDVAAGVTCWMANIERYEGYPLKEALSICREAEGGTIDLRVDYIAPGRGKYFTAKAEIVRFGERVIVVRMELVNDAKELIALGTGTFFIGRKGRS
jgi:acyl-coenzyme A thioesterase PaaI-like protein